MKNYLLCNCIISLIFLLIGCKHHAVKKQYPLKFVRIDSFSFRRNYFYDKEMNVEEDKKFHNRNPEIATTEDTSKGRLQLFKRLNLLDKNNDLILENWKKLSSKPNDKIFLKNKLYNLKIIDSLFHSGEELKYTYNVFVSNSTEKILASDFFEYLGTMPHNLTYAVSDFNNDGSDELIIMENWYICNGDNYDFSIFKLAK